MKLMRFTGHDGKPVVVNMDKLLTAVPFHHYDKKKEMTTLVFGSTTHVVIDMTLDAFLDLMTR